MIGPVQVSTHGRRRYQNPAPDGRQVEPVFRTGSARIVPWWLTCVQCADVEGVDRPSSRISESQDAIHRGDAPSWTGLELAEWNTPGFLVRRPTSEGRTLPTTSGGPVRC